MHMYVATCVYSFYHCIATFLYYVNKINYAKSSSCDGRARLLSNID